jgi:NosR/NirI family nitrous oxide reductase transcriptional regulator
MTHKRLYIYMTAMLALVFVGCSSGPADKPAVQTQVVEQSAQTGGYKDGTYSGVARGYKKGLHVEVTVQDGKIAAVQIAKNNEDEPYLTDSLVIIPKIVETQSTEVDIIAGATKTCQGIGKAVKNALEQAK